MLLVAMLLTSVELGDREVAYRPLRGSFRLAPLISAIGMSIVLSKTSSRSRRARATSRSRRWSRQVYTLFQGSGTYPVTIALKQLIIFALTAVLLLAFWIVVQKTALGRAQRACEQDRRMAALLGVDVDRTISLTFVMGAALAAVAGTMFLMFYGVVNSPTASSRASRPSPRRFWAASARCPAPCSAAC